MKSGDIFKDIFGLAVRLLGLVFVYLGLSAMPPLLDLGAIETAAKGDIITAVLPVVFNLAVAWWLIGGGLLIRRAYPDASKPSRSSRMREEGAAPAIKPGQFQGGTDMDAVEKKLEPLVEKPKEDGTDSRAL
jgi:hypothetical protein